MKEKGIKNLKQKNLTSNFQHLKASKGITLIALVITIIVMLILVAVTINMAINGGLFNYAGKAVGETQNAINGEQNLGDGRINVENVWYNSIEEYVKAKADADADADDSEDADDIKDANIEKELEGKSLEEKIKILVSKSYKNEKLDKEQLKKNLIKYLAIPEDEISESENDDGWEFEFTYENSSYVCNVSKDGTVFLSVHGHGHGHGSGSGNARRGYY